MGKRKAGNDGGELERRIRLADMGAPVRVKERDYALLRGCSVKKIQSDRLNQIGVPPLREGRSVYYDLRQILDSLRATA